MRFSVNSRFPKLVGVMLLLSLMIMNISLKAQSISGLGLPSPNNNFLHSVSGPEGVGVDLYTGSATVSIPITELSGRDISIPVSINYSGGRGIKVQEYASKVGLGWQLSAGGNITRAVRGFPDEFANGYIGTGQWGKKVAQWVNQGTQLPIEIRGNNFQAPTADGEPDIFFVKTPFFSFQFTFDENGSIVVSNGSGISLIATNFNNTTNYTNSSFTVKDENGNTYYFGETSSSREQTTTKLYNSNYTYISSWYLTKIITAQSKETVYFNYLTSSSNEVLKHYTSSYEGFLQYDAFGQPTIVNGQRKDDETTSTILAPKHLSNITTPRGRIEFSYQLDRSDVTGAARLTNVTLSAYNNGSSLKQLRKFEFVYSYFGTQQLNKRLKLDRINIFNGTIPILYRSFTYYTGQSLPNRNDTEQSDFWGYYRKRSLVEVSPLINPSVRYPVLNDTKAGVLVGVKSMGGGEVVLDYELNSYRKTGATSNTAIGGLRVKSIGRRESPTSTLLQTTYFYQENNGKSTGSISTESYSNLSFFESNDNGALAKNMSETPSSVFDINGTFIGYTLVKEVHPNNGYSITRFSSFNDYPDIVQATQTPLQNPLYTWRSSSNAYKRGLPKSTKVYNSQGGILLLDSNVYQALTTAQKKSFGYNKHIESVSAVAGSTIYSWAVELRSQYHAPVENFRLTKNIKREYSTQNPSEYSEVVATYGYAANKRHVRSVTTKNSKGLDQIYTVYYSGDDPAIIPMVQAGVETAGLNRMSLVSHVKNAKVHESMVANGKKSEVHLKYIYDTQVASFAHLANLSDYRNGILNTQTNMKYDAVQSRVSTKENHFQPTTVIYGYGNSIPIAEVENADYETVVSVLGGQATVNNFTSIVAPTETQVNNFLAPLRSSSSLANALVTSYTHEPMVGVKSKKDPLGTILIYEYDGLQRLERVRDHNSKIIDEYQYNVIND